MQAFVAPLMELAEYDAILKGRKKKGMVQIAGCVTSQKTHMMYALSDGFSRKIIAASSEMKAKQIYEEYKVFSFFVRDFVISFIFNKYFYYVVFNC